MEWCGSNLITRHQHRFRPFFLRKTAGQKIPFSSPFPEKRSDCESQKSGFGFDPKNPPWVRILWIHDPFLDLPKKNSKSIRFWIRKSGFGFGNPYLDFPEKTHPNIHVSSNGVRRKVIADCVEYLRPWRRNQHWYLGNRSREPVTSIQRGQTNWFAKRGIPWHIQYVTQYPATSV